MKERSIMLWEEEQEYSEFNQCCVVVRLYICVQLYFPCIMIPDSIIFVFEAGAIMVSAFLVQCQKNTI